MTAKSVNPNMTLKEARGMPTPQCPECGSHNVHVGRKAYVDFYGIPYVWRCECGWEDEIVRDPNA